MRFRKIRVSTLLYLLPVLVFAMSAFGQVAVEGRADEPGNAAQAEGNLGYPQDWSSRHLIMPGRDGLAAVRAGAHDPRYVYNLVMREVAIQRTQTDPDFVRVWDPWQPLPPFPPLPPTVKTKRKIKIDWAVSLENGYVPVNQFPAKYQFNVNSDSCSDYVVYGLTTTATQANLVGISNLYTGGTLACNGGETSGQPLVAFAYNTVTQTGGQIKTSPSISEDGTKVAFVESTTSGSYFHVLVLPNPIPVTTGKAVGTVISPTTPTACPSGNPTTAGCMTTLTIETTATNSNSSPWIDYASDTAYVGSDNGWLYKITPVFKGGAPALVSDTNFPFQVSTNAYNNILTDPVVDNVDGYIFMGDGEGYLYSVKYPSPGKKVNATQTIGWAYDGSNDGSGKPGTGVVDAPVVVIDPSNPTSAQVFAFTGCSYVVGVGGAITQLSANFATGTPSTSNTVDLGSASGNGDCTTKNVHFGAFDNTFWLSGSASGHMMACGFVNDGGAPAEPKIYSFAFTNHVLNNSAAAVATFVPDTNKGDECSPLTEFYNGTSDLLFFGVGPGLLNGYVESSTLTATTPYMTTPSCTLPPTSSCVTAPGALGGTSGIIIDNELANGGTNIYFSTLAGGSVNGQSCHVAGGALTPYCAVKLTQAALQ